MNEIKKQTVLELSSVEKALVFLVPPLLGLVIGWFLPVIAKWAVSLDWLPFQGPLGIIASFHGWKAAAAIAVIGLFGGIWLTRAAFKESLVAVVTDREVSLTINNEESVFSKDSISGVFTDQKQLVLLGAEGQELFREKLEPAVEKAADAFRGHGYVWLGTEDPFKDEYKRWVPDMPDLEPGANALLKAREKALKQDEKADAKELKAEISKLGITVRDQGSRQYWRIYKTPSA
ncbi:YqeB family protein [Bacillus amyloliquefaciens]|uniref:YqeB family protein n=1 Tax=Bacillus amyloliquefaciens TaxID=1390 RepID=UPI003C755137